MKINSMSWEECCKPKVEGGLGLKNILEWNQASISFSFLLKITRRLFCISCGVFFILTLGQCGIYGFKLLITGFIIPGLGNPTLIVIRTIRRVVWEKLYTCNTLQKWAVKDPSHVTLKNQ